MVEVGSNSQKNNNSSTTKNLLNNSGFENGTKGWNKGKGCPINEIIIQGLEIVLLCLREPNVEYFRN